MTALNRLFRRRTVPGKPNKLASALLNLNFLSGVLDKRITFSRTTNATVTGSNGLIQNAPMNLLTFSEQFDNAAWTKTRATITANAIAAPDGSVTADKLIASTDNDDHRISSADTFTGARTLSVYAKAGEYPSVVLNIAGIATCSATFRLTDGVITANGANATPSITSVGNGWYRCAISYTAAGTANPQIYVNNGSSNSFVGNGVNGIYIWGAQLELGSTATTYNPTTVKNLLGFTEHFDNAAWTKSNASISATKVDDIYGQPFAQKLVEDTANSFHQVLQNVTVVSGTPYALRVYAKAGERNWLCVYEDSASSKVWFDLSTGTVGTVVNATANIQSLGNGWYRCTAIYTQSGTVGRTRIAVASANGTISYTGDGTSGIYIFGAQLADSASVDPYVYQPVAAPTSTAYYGPRFDYDPVTLAPKGLLIEEQRTNLFTYSEDFTNAAWTKGQITVTANSSVSPDGVADADTIAANSTVPEAYIRFTTTQATSTAHTVSVYGKKGTVNFLRLRNLAVSGAPSAWFNLNTGAVATVNSGLSATITPVGNGWYRCTITGTSLGVIVNNLVDIAPATADNSASVNNGDSVIVYGAQLEAGAFATSYIPTVASQVTRAADSASMIGNNFARWFNQTAGTLYAEGSTEYSGTPTATRVLANIRSTDDANRISIRFGSNASERGGSFFVFSNSTTSAQINEGSALVADQSMKFAGAYAVNDFAFAKNNVLVGTDTSGALPVGVTELQLGASNLCGNIKRIAYYNRRLANTELSSITL